MPELHFTYEKLMYTKYDCYASTNSFSTLFFIWFRKHTFPTFILNFLCIPIIWLLKKKRERENSPCTNKFNSLASKKKFSLVQIADNKFKVAEMAEFFPDRVEKNMGKGENAGYQHFLLFPHYFQKISFPGSLKPAAVL